MLLSTSRFGDIEVDPERTIRFDHGLLGFPDARSFILVETEADPDFYWLQCVEDGRLAFLATVPWDFFPSYEPEIDDEAQAALGIETEADVQVLSLLTVDREAGSVTANLLGPLVVNLRTRLARQVVLHDSGWPLAAPLGAPC